MMDFAMLVLAGAAVVALWALVALAYGVILVDGMRQLLRWWRAR